MPTTSEKKDVIKEAELTIIMQLRETVSADRKNIRKMEGELAGKEKEIMDRLREGASCKGKLVASIEKEMGNCRPAWKDDYLGHMVSVHNMAEKAAEEEVKAKYPPSETEKLSIGFTKGPPVEKPMPALPLRK